VIRTDAEGTDGDFFLGLLLGFFLNWLGFLIAYCCLFTYNSRGRRGAVWGLLISIVANIILWSAVCSGGAC
jgi:hypothetical protein